MIVDAISLSSAPCSGLRRGLVVCRHQRYTFYAAAAAVLMGLIRDATVQS
jgi:hypothetical protein